jgi:ATP-dependent helicase Lhr and Lhr-like helicase
MQVLFHNSQLQEEVPQALAWAHPLVQEWFVQKFGTPTEPQEEGWPYIVSGRSTLISAPTGSGKTLAAFLACIDGLVRKAISGGLQNRIEVVYVSPLKALGNDIQKNLERPLAEIAQLAGERGLLMPQIRTFVRTGDTPPSDRQRMLKSPPHILVTTPESLYILLTAEKSRELLRDVETVIIDEIHAIADDKRGAHLALSLERLDVLAHRKPVRIGLSATQKPIELVAEFLAGASARPEIVNVGHRRKLDFAVEVPPSPLSSVMTHEMWDEVYDRLVQLIEQHRSTLIFVNTRAMAERIAHCLAQRLGEDAVAAHHGSLARKLRLHAESRLRKGELRALVATASLELGIDVGHIDLVCHIGSPRSIAVMLQRVGRAGHWRGAIPKGRIFATTRDELIECAALVRAIEAGELDALIIPDTPLDVLAQQIVAMCAADEWREQDVFEVVRRAYPYRNLTQGEFEQIVGVLSDGIVASRGRYGAYLHRDRVNGVLKARRGSRMIAVTNGGAIPDASLFTVVALPDEAVVGTLDEDFAVEISRGDIMLLGSTSWQIHRVESSGRVLVEDAHGAAPTIPFWRGEAPARTPELSQQVAAIRSRVDELTPNLTAVGLSPAIPEVASAVEWLKTECHVDNSAAEQIVEYIVTGRAVLGAVPTQTTLIAERFFDEGGGMQLIIHAPFGARINKAWGLALRKRFCRSFNFELQAAATENGLNIALAEQHSFPLAEVFEFLREQSVQEVLEQAALPSPIFKTRWRWDAGRSLALLRYRNGKKIPPAILRIRSDDLLASVFPDVAACQENIEGDIKIPDHPLVREVMKDVLTEAMDIEGLKAVLRGMADGSIRLLAVDTPVPSQFSHEILNSAPYAYLDDAPLEERRARAVEMRRTLPDSVLQEVGGLDLSAIEQVRNEAWPDVRDADELHDALLTMLAIPENVCSAGELQDIAAAKAPSPVTSASNPAEGGCATKCVDQSFNPAKTIGATGAWVKFFGELQEQKRAARARIPERRPPPCGERECSPPLLGNRCLWVAAEKLTSFRALYPDSELETQIESAERESFSGDDARLTMVTGWMMHSGPVTAGQLAAALYQPMNEIEIALLRLEAKGSVLRGKFARHDGVTEWCDRRLLARIHRLTLGVLRKQIEPATPAQFMRWLPRWQHVAAGTQLSGERGLLEIVRQLQGFEIPANAWERQILPQRMKDYDPAHLDHLCLTGAVGWGRLSPHPATLEATAGGNRRVVPTSVAPLTFFLRSESDWMASAPYQQPGDIERCLSDVAKGVFTYLQSKGASFFADVVRGTAKLKAEVETGLWELVAAGVVTADGFDNLRTLIAPRHPHVNGRGKRPRHSAGRWSIMHAEPARDQVVAVEATCRMLLDRYGIVFRELLARESVLPKWRELLLTFRRLEDRGEVRGGRFVSGFIGEQFALPEAVQSLRGVRNAPVSGETITISAADPLNLAGIILPGERVPAISGRTVSFREGSVVEAEGEISPALQVLASASNGA